MLDVPQRARRAGQWEAKSSISHRLYTSNSWRSLSAATGWKECGAKWRRPNIQAYMSAKQPLGFGTWSCTALEILLLSSTRTVQINPPQCGAKAQTEPSHHRASPVRVKTVARPQWTTLAVDGRRKWAYLDSLGNSECLKPPSKGDAGTCGLADGLKDEGCSACPVCRGNWR